MHQPHASAQGISVVIPVYNSSAILPELVARLENALPALTEHYEVILVNDDSKDSSWQVIMEQARFSPRVRGIDMARNYGQHHCLLTGLRAARYAIIVTMDDDLQHMPESIGMLIGKLSEGYDVVYGMALHRTQSPARNILTAVYYGMAQYLFRIAYARSLSAFRALRRDKALNIRIAEGAEPFLHLLLMQVTRNVGSLHVAHQKRIGGHSAYSFAKLAQMAFAFLREARALRNQNAPSIPLENYALPVRGRVNL